MNFYKVKTPNVTTTEIKKLNKKLNITCIPESSICLLPGTINLIYFTYFGTAWYHTVVFFCSALCL